MSVGLIFGLNYWLTGGQDKFFGLTILAGVGLGCWSNSPIQIGIISGLIGALIGGVIFALSKLQIEQFALGATIAGAITGLIGGLRVGSLNHITLVETINWKWTQFWKRTIPGLIVGLIVGLMIGLFGGWSSGVSSGLMFGVIFWLASGFVGGFTDEVKVGKASPNQGIKLSLRNFVIAFLVTGLGVELIFWLIAGMNVDFLVLKFFVLIVGLNRGGSAVIKHYALRLTLWWAGNTPLNLVRFLDDCSKLIFLHRVGGGYIFIHRMLLDYFADLPQSTRGGKGKTE